MIVPYDFRWKNEFERLKIFLLQELQGLQADIQHVGSTSIPGMFAKPILDIDIIIPEKRSFNSVSEVLTKSGYIAKGEQGVKGRFAFRQSADIVPFNKLNQKWQTHHLYVCYKNSLAVKNHLLFRDALLKNTGLVTKYNALKKELVNNSAITRDAYTKMKTYFILEVLANTGLNEEELAEIKQANL